MIVRKTTQAEGKRVNELFAIAFEQPVSNGPANPENPKTHHWAAFADDDRTMLSTFSISDYSVRFDGNACRMAGVGGVATLPQYRRQGGIRGCFQTALPELYKAGYELSYLYPFSTEYYRKFGYECCVRKLDWKVDLRLLKVPRLRGTVKLSEPHDPMTEAVMALDRQWEEQYNLMVLHEKRDYEWCRKADPAAQQTFSYIYFDESNCAKAYTTFRLANELDGRNLVCSKFCFLDWEGFFGLMGLFKAMASDHAYVKFDTPMDTSLMYLMPEWSLGAAEWSIRANAGMVRVVNVEAVLKKARYIGSGTLRLKILDPQIPENDRCFEIRYSEGKADSVAYTQAEPDTELTIGTFSALICGVSDLEGACCWMNEISIKNPDADYSAVFYRKPLMIVDYF